MATIEHQGMNFREFVRSFAGTAMILDFAFKECECEHASRILDVDDENVRVVAFDDETGKPIGEGEFPWSSVVSVRLSRVQWDHTFAHDESGCDHEH
jgi:hypothetical protein